MAWFPSLLSPLQKRILDAVSGRLPGLFLTGGTALGAFYLGHRRSADLDLFTRESDNYDACVRQLLRLLEGSGLPAAAGLAGPGFRRFIFSDGNETVPVDVVLDTAEALAAPSTTPDGLVIDSLDDIAANKLCAILGRAEVRDYVDLYFLAKAGKEPLAFLSAARRKDGGLEPATLAFVLSDVKVRRVPENLVKPVSAAELQAFIDDLRHRLAREAFPKT
ncbi:MAG: nucleotidyl transferase AbiEii/AbiGii toxin family protein [Deltaproteobacteria bacterium]|nr:nucleotidyl transferase AbiEii/AbiGii toxin family protein [Deltaproteobacteria bacterium]